MRRVVVLTLVFTLLLAACVADGGTAGSSTTESASAPLTSSLPATTTITTMSPTATAALPPGADPVLGIVPPEPTDYPFIEGSYRYAEWNAQCAAAAGFEWKVVAGATPHLSYVGTATPRRAEVTNRCREIAHERGWVIPNPFDGSAEANAILYDIYVDIHDCMVEHGYPTTEPPSKEAFTAEGESLWTPWEEMWGSVLYVDPESDWGPAGTMPPGDRLQYQAQETCGGSPNEVYDQQLQEQG